MSFSQMGLERAEAEIKHNEENSPSGIYSEVKPFTTKAPVHVIEALDLVAEEFGLSRNSLVLQILDSYLGNAFVDYQNGYGAVFNEDDHVFPLDQLNALFEKHSPSDKAKSYLNRSVCGAMGLPLEVQE